MGGVLGKALRDKASDADLEAAFRKYDVDGNGSLDKDEVHVLGRDLMELVKKSMKLSNTSPVM
jgi:Ca2+-binding EF-hand superfamily protein